MLAAGSWMDGLRKTLVIASLIAVGIPLIKEESDGDVDEEKSAE